MMRRVLSFAVSSRLIVLFFVMVVASTPLLGQIATGLPPFGSFSGGPSDTVNNANLNVHLEIPVITKPGACPR